MDLSNRSSRKELLDRDDIPFADIERNMYELDVINTWLGGHAISRRGIHTLLKKNATRHSAVGKPHQISICEIGCGGGDNLRALSQWCDKHQIDVTVIGIDLNPHCIRTAREKWTGTNAAWIHSDYRTVSFEDNNNRPDIVFSSLFCHHFYDDELVSMLQWMDHQARIGWFINDLHRHILAYHSIRILTKWFSRSYLVKNDAPLSVLRGFRKQEWKKLLRKAQIDEYSLHWKWAFRWLLIRKK
jgi:2-polyprenyl-3-methyl-5-hydroxy-6-metoxy-1,4-benzoquinol methylase